MLEKFVQRHVQRSRQERRLMTVVSSTARVASQRATYRRACDALQRLQERKQRAGYRGGPVAGGQTHCSTAHEAWRDADSARVRPVQPQPRPSYPPHSLPHMNSSSREYGSAPHRSQAGAQAQGRPYEHGSASIDATTGDSVVQLEFDALVRRALIAYGPPLPAEFVMDNHVVLGTRGHEEGADGGQAAEAELPEDDVGADGTSFFFYDEVALRVHELVAIVRRLRPDFDPRRDCGGMPLSLLIQNCPYLRAFGGKVRYMRYLRRPSDSTAQEPRLVLSVAKYKMREVPSRDRIRQGPQPWLYGHMW